MEDPRLEAEGWEKYKQQKDFEKGGIQSWAEGLLDDQKPLECLYVRHPETDEEVIIVKIDTSITVCKRTITTQDAVAVVGQMAQGVWEQYESERILRPDGGGVE